MNIVQISKVLSNQRRVSILKLLKNPAQNFPPHQDLAHFNDGVCVQYIQKKLNLSQSTVSHYLYLMGKVGLVKSIRHGKWTYYKRNEELITKYIKLLKIEL